MMTRTFHPTFLLVTLLLWGGCAIEPDLVDLQKQVQTLTLKQEATQQQEQQARDRLSDLESKLDEHDFLVGELIKTEEEATRAIGER